MRNTICALTLNPAIDKTIYVDDFKVNSVNRASNSCVVPGSKGINVARIMAKCDIDSVCFGFIGGANGEYVLEQIRNDGVKDDFINVDYDIRTNIKLVDLKGATYTDVNFESGGVPSAQNIEELKEKTRKLAKNSALIALGGSVAAGVDESIYCELAMIAKGEGALVSADCYNEPLRHVLEAKPFIIKPNLDELESTFGEKYNSIDEIVCKAQKLYADGIENVLVSLGKDGAVAVCGGDAFRLYTDDLPVYNTVGAGDAFLSGFIYGWHRGFDVIECLKHSVSFSQVVVSSHADGGRDLIQLTRYVDSARVEPLYTKGGALR